MTGAELKVTLEGLGISPGWFAARLGISMRTVVRWFDLPTLDEAAHTELRLLEEKTVAEMVSMLGKIKEGKPIRLKTYRTDKEYRSKMAWPASWHRSLTFRVLEHLRAQGEDVSVVYATPRKSA